MQQKQHIKANEVLLKKMKGLNRLPLAWKEGNTVKSTS